LLDSLLQEINKSEVRIGDFNGLVEY